MIYINMRKLKQGVCTLYKDGKGARVECLRHREGGKTVVEDKQEFSTVRAAKQWRENYTFPALY